MVLYLAESSFACDFDLYRLSAFLYLVIVLLYFLDSLVTYTLAVKTSCSSVQIRETSTINRPITPSTPHRGTLPETRST